MNRTNLGHALAELIGVMLIGPVLTGVGIRVS